MINERILNEFRQHDTSPQYIMLITDIKNGEVVCNEESLIISGKQIFLSLDEYLNGIDRILEKNEIDPTEMSKYLENLSAEDLNKIEEYLKGIGKFIKYRDNNIKTIEKDLTIYSNVTLDDNNLYYGQLNGYISNEKVNEINKNSNNQSSHYIEMVDVTLQKEVDITFSQPYKNPKIAITIDEKDEDIYNRIVPKLIKEREEDEEYIGVKITFTNLRNRSSYPKIGVLIIGDEKEETYDEEGNVEPTYHNLTVNLYYEEIDEETNRPIQIPIEDTTILINDEEFVSDECGTVVASLEDGEYEVTVKESGYRYTPETVNLTSNKTIGLKLTPGITATFQGNIIELGAGWDGTIDWGDGETSTFEKTDSFPMNTITHTYNDEETEHTIFIKTSDFKGAFTGNKALTSIKISNYTIKEFSVMGAFSSCSNLSSVIINVPIKIIPTGTFWACNFEKIILPDSVETIGAAFGQNKALNNIIFPKSIKSLSIGRSCFSGCNNLNQVVFPESITSLSIGGSCFTGCNSLNQVVFPESMIALNIEEGCFSGCTSLNQIDFPESITNLNLGGGCFSACSNLNQIVFPESITNLNIGGSCFSGCTNLNQIVFPESLVNLNIERALLGETAIRQITLPKTVNPYILPTDCIADNYIQQIILSDSITQLNNNCISSGATIPQISLPKSISVLSEYWCSIPLQQIILNWTNEDIIPWKAKVYGGATLIIPPGTKNNYIEKGYPENKLVEKVSDEDDSS